MGFSVSQAMSGAGQAVADVAGEYAKTAINRDAQIDLMKVKADIDTQRDARLNDYAVTMERDVKQPFTRSEREEGQKFTGGENEKNRTSQENMNIDRLALEEFLGRQRNDIANKELGIRGAQLKNDNARLKLEQDVKDIQIKAAKLDLADKQRFETLKAAYVNPTTDDKTRESIADSITTLLGKDKYTPLMSKDDSGNPQYVGAFNNRSGEVKTGAGAATGGVVKPKTQAEFDALPPGTRFINPADGKEMTKRGPAEKKDKPAAGASADKPAGIVSSAMQSPSGSAFSRGEQLAQEAYGTPDETLGGLLQALEAPNLSVQQKSVLSTQLQQRLRELGKMGN